jgi:4-hydroxy-tetrahydrodipicolinate synthase
MSDLLDFCDKMCYSCSVVRGSSSDIIRTQRHLRVERQMKLRGIIPPIVTPLHGDETVHDEQLRRVTEHLLAAGVHAIFVNGSMGAFSLLSDAEQYRAIAIVVDQVGGRVPVMAGVSDTATRLVIEKARRAEELGADCLSVLPPYYGKFGKPQLVRFYREVARNVGLPVFAYNNPWTTLSNIDAAALVELADEPNFGGIKDSCNNAIQYQDIVRKLGGRPDFSILLGTTHLTSYGLFLGADGIIEGLHHIKPEWAVGIWNAAQAGDWKTVAHYQLKLESLIPFAMHGEVWGGVELALQELGLCDKITAHPFVPMSDPREIAEVKALVRDLLLA